MAHDIASSLALVLCALGLVSLTLRVRALEKRLAGDPTDAVIRALNDGARRGQLPRF